MVTNNGGSSGVAPKGGKSSSKGKSNRLAAIGDGNPAFSVDMSRAAPVNNPMMAYRNPGNADNGSALAGMVNGSGALNNRAALSSLVGRNNTGPRQDILGAFGNFFNAMGARGVPTGATGSGSNDAASMYASRGVHPDTTRQSQQQMSAPNEGHSEMDAARLAAQAARATPASLDSSSGGGGGQPQLQLAAFQMPALPTLESTGDYNSYLQQALGGLNLGALDKSYQDNIDLIGSDTRTSVGNIGAAAQGAQQNIAGGSALLQQTGQQNNANNSALEAALSQQQAATAQGSGAANNSLAQALGTGTAVGGNDNSSLAAQNAAAQQYLAAAAQNNQAANDATTSAQVADNQNYGRVVDAKATSDSQNAQMAGRDAQSQVGLQRSQADLQARESASAQAAGMQSAAQQNAIARYNAQLQGVLGMGGLAQAEQRLGLDKYSAENAVQYQNNSLAAQVAGAKAGNLQAAYAPLFSQIANAEKYGQVNSPLTGQGIGSAEQLAQAMLEAYGQGGYTPTISQGLLNGSQDSGIAPTLQDVLSSNGQATKKKKR